MKEEFILNVPGHISVKEAAKILGISVKSIYRFVDEGRMPALRMGNSILVPMEAVEQFKPSPLGRLRTTPPRWREYRSGSKLFMTSIDVHVHAGQEAELLKQLDTIRQEEKYTFPGTIARYISRSGQSPMLVHIWLLWKDSEMPDEAAPQKALTDFETEFAAVLDWSTAQHRISEVLIHT